MYGNLVTNRQFETLRKQGAISIDPFDIGSLKESSYTLTPGHVLEANENGKWKIVYTFSDDDDEYIIPANGYVVVQPAQMVRIRVPGIVGSFILASNNIEEGRQIVAGQIDSKYGMKGESLRFGVKNLLSTTNRISGSTRLVHIQLTDMRGSTLDPVFQNEKQQKLWNSRTSQLDDINYGNAGPE